MSKNIFIVQFFLPPLRRGTGAVELYDFVVFKRPRTVPLEDFQKHAVLYNILYKLIFNLMFVSLMYCLPGPVFIKKLK